MTAQVLSALNAMLDTFKMKLLDAFQLILNVFLASKLGQFAMNAWLDSSSQMTR